MVGLSASDLELIAYIISYLLAVKWG